MHPLPHSLTTHTQRRMITRMRCFRLPQRPVYCTHPFAFKNLEFFNQLQSLFLQCWRWRIGRNRDDNCSAVCCSVITRPHPANPSDVCYSLVTRSHPENLSEVCTRPHLENLSAAWSSLFTRASPAHVTWVKRKKTFERNVGGWTDWRIGKQWRWQKQRDKERQAAYTWRQRKHHNASNCWKTPAWSLHRWRCTISGW